MDKNILFKNFVNKIGESLNANPALIEGITEAFDVINESTSENKWELLGKALNITESGLDANWYSRVYVDYIVGNEYSDYSDMIVAFQDDDFETVSVFRAKREDEVLSESDTSVFDLDTEFSKIIEEFNRLRAEAISETSDL